MPFFPLTDPSCYRGRFFGRIFKQFVYPIELPPELQRRRWTPSTIANVADLLSDYKRVIKNNDDVSFLYIVYQGRRGPTDSMLF